MLVVWKEEAHRGDALSWIEQGKGALDLCFMSGRTPG
jgi:hypothetical protein